MDETLRRYPQCRSRAKRDNRGAARRLRSPVDSVPDGARGEPDQSMMSTSVSATQAGLYAPPSMTSSVAITARGGCEHGAAAALAFGGRDRARTGSRWLRVRDSGQRNHCRVGRESPTGGDTQAGFDGRPVEWGARWIFTDDGERVLGGMWQADPPGRRCLSGARSADANQGHHFVIVSAIDSRSSIA